MNRRKEPASPAPHSQGCAGSAESTIAKVSRCAAQVHLQKQPGRHEAGLVDPEKFVRSRFHAFLAERQFSRDLAFALWLPLVLAAIAVRCCDAPGAAVGTCEAGKERGLALSGFPCGARAASQLLHVLAHLPWYLLVRPVRVGDWVGLLSNAHHMAFTGLVLVLAAAPRQGRLWAWWRRHRVLVAWSTARGGCTLLHLATYPLLPRARWPDAVFGPYTLLVSTHPLASTLTYCALDLFMGFPFLPAFAGILLHMAVVWFSAYTVAPSIIHLEQQTTSGPITDPAVSNSSIGATRSLLRCDHPRFAALLSCRPAWAQCLVAALMVAIPATLATLSQRWLWRRYQRALAKQQQQQQWTPRGTNAHTNASEGDLQQQQASPELQRKEHQERPRYGGMEQQHVAGHGHQEQQQQQQLALVGVASPTAGAGGAPLTSLGNPFYRSRVRSRDISVKVLHHPGSHEEFGPRLAAAVQRAVMEVDGEQRQPPPPLLLPPPPPPAPLPPPQQQHEQQQHADQEPQGEAAAAAGPGAPSGGPSGGSGSKDCSKGRSSNSSSAVLDASAPRVPERPRTARGGGLHAVWTGGVVLRGCTQVILWSGLLPRGRGRGWSTRLPDPNAPGGSGGGGSVGGGGSGGAGGAGGGGQEQGGRQREQEDAARELAGRLLSAMSGEELVSGVCVQVGGGGATWELGVGRGRQQQQQEAEQGVYRLAAVHLLRLCPPALALPTRGSEELGEGRATDSQPDGSLRLLLSSPVPQAARLMVVRRQPGAVALEGEAQGSHVTGGFVAAEFPLQLLAGVQEVEVNVAGVVRAVAGGVGEAARGGAGQGQPHGAQAEVLQLLLLPPAHEGSARGDEEAAAAAGAGGASSSGGDAGGGDTPLLPPLLHFSAPLLLLPVEAVAELRELDRRMQVDVGEGEASEHIAATATAAAAGSPAAAAMGPDEATAVSYWCEHMAPLLYDIALALRAAADRRVSRAGGSEQSGSAWGSGDSGEGHGADEGVQQKGYASGNEMDEIWSVLVPDLLSFLRGQRMAATERVLLDQLPPLTHVLPTPPHSASAPPPPHAGVGQQQEHAAAGGRRPRSSAGDIPSAAAPQHEEDTTLPSSSGLHPVRIPTSSSDSPTPSATSLHHLFCGFQDPALERQFRVWRTAGLAKAALPLMLLAAVPHLYALGASVWEQVRVRQLPAVRQLPVLGGPEVVAGWLQALCGGVFYLGSWAGDVAGYVVVLLAVAVHAWKARVLARKSKEQQLGGKTRRGKDEAWKKEQPKLEAQGLVPERKRGGGGASSHAEAVDAAAAEPTSLVSAYAWGAMAAGPLLLLLLAVVALRLQLRLPDMVTAGGNDAGFHVAATRAVIGPCVQQLPARQVVWASPVLLLGEALLLGVLKPGWSNAHVWGVAAGWRLIALVLASGFEWRARRRFLLGLEAVREVVEVVEEGAAGGACVEGPVTLLGSLVEAKKVV